jgi:hypothetical protein
MSPEYEPSTWFGLLPYLFFAAPGAATAVLVWWGQRKAKGHRKKQAEATDELKATTSAIRNNVQNGHKTLMRDDLDGLVEGIKAIRDAQEQQGVAIHRIDVRVQRIEGDLSTEREERIAADKRLER